MDEQPATREYRFRFMFPEGHPMYKALIEPNPVTPHLEMNVLEFYVTAPDFWTAQDIANKQYAKWKAQNGY